MKSKNIELYYKKGYISQKALWCCIKLIQIYNNSDISTGSFNLELIKVQQSKNFNEDIMTCRIKNLLDYQWIIETLKLQIAISPDVLPKHLYLFLDFLFNDLSMRELKSKYRLDHGMIKDIVILFSECIIVLMRERKILK